MFFKKRTNIKNTTDEELISLYKSTSESMYIGELFDRYTQLCFLVCMKYLKDEEESKDAVMLVFERLIGDLHKHDIKQFRFWLHTVVKNHCLALLEKKKRLPTQSTDYLENLGESMENQSQTTLIDEESALTDLQLAHLPEAISHLNTEQRICIELFYLQQKSYVEVADATGYDLKQVKSYIQNGKRNLKILLSKMMNS